jgi:hypothetical protein
VGPVSFGPPIDGRRAQPTPIAGLRMLFFAFSLAVVLISFVVVPVLAAGMDSDPEDGLDPTVLAAGVFVLGVVMYVVARLVSRPDRFRACRSSTEVLGMFRVQFILQLALAETSMLVGLVAFFLTGSVVPYVVGAAWTALGFLRIAPTQRRLQHLQDEIALQGCQYQLLDVLQSPGPAGWA